MTTPIIRCVKKQLGAEVHYLVKPNFRSVLEHNPYIDKLLAYNSEILPQLKGEKYDLVIDLHKSILSTKIKLQLGVKTLSYNKVNIEKWIFTTFQKDILPQKHLVDRYFEGIKSIGVVNDGEGLDYFFQLENLSLNLPNQYEVIVLGAAHMTKRITNALAKKIIEHRKKPMILLGGNDVSSQAEELMQNNVINMVGKTTLNESANILIKASLVHTGDTGLMHMAAAMKKPTHVYWANTHPKMGMYPYYGEIDIYTKWFEVAGLSCRPCSKLGYKECPKGHHKCMDHEL